MGQSVVGEAGVTGKAESDELKGGGKRLAGFGYWLWLGRFFGWVGRWAFIESSSPVR